MMPTDEQRRALAMLANTGRRGNTEAIMAVHFTVELLAGLVRQGWASVDVESRLFRQHRSKAAKKQYRSRVRS